MNTRRIFFAVLTAIALTYAVGAHAVVFTNDAAISAFDKSYENDTVVVSNCTVTVDSAHTFTSLLVGSGGTVTHTYSAGGSINVPASVANEVVTLTDTNAAALAVGGTLLSNRVVDASNFVTYVETADYEVTFQGNTILINRTTNSTIPDGGTVLVSYDLSVSGSAGMNLTLTGTLDVQPGGAIHANAKGYGGGQGAGLGGTAGNTLSGAGGGHGGYGGLSVSNAPGGNCYGAFSQPATLGSGGGQGANGPGANGGGAIKLTVSGAATINGAISANGMNATNSRSGGGAGGSIWISCASISGNGGLTANGGAGEPIFGGGGGGGRIAILPMTTDSFTGGIAAYGGNGWKYGGAGTIHRKTGSQTGLLLVDNGGHSGTNTLLSSTSSTSDLIIRSNAVARLSGTLFARHATIQSGSAVDGDVQGSAPGTGSGAGTFSNNDIGNRPCSGGGNGGYGGTASTNVPGGSAYGSLNSIYTAGGGGGNFSPVSIGGYGGGLLTFNLTGTLTNAGKISANGGNGAGTGGGGGAGGAISITANALTGAGSITANGGNGANNIGGGGGGGRIYISAYSNTFTGTITAYGGTGSGIGGAGSIYSFRGSVGFGPPLYLVDNGGRVGTNTPVNITESYTDYVFRSNAVIVPATGTISWYANTLTLTSSCSLLITGSYSSQIVLTVGKVTVDASSSISADGAGYAAAQGSGLGGNYGGGGHGGAGGGGNTNALGGGSYGSITLPTTVGSGGGNASNSSNPGGAGGGALRISLPGDFTLNGKISINGANSALGGGGAGGSVYITAGRLLGSGQITAKGGSCLGPTGGGGGGGRIALYLTTNSFTGPITAYGGSGFVRGGAGTIYLENSLPPGPIIRKLTLDNGGVIGTNTPIASALSSSTDLVASNGAIAFVNYPTTSLGNLTVGSNAAVTLASGNALTVSSATIAPGGAVHSDGLGNSVGTGQGASVSLSTSPPISNCGGGGYGGYGGSGASANARGGNSFISGSTISPTGTGGLGGGSG
ncbi:MAG: hypothetical protein EPO07_00925, partial [Verrucomicrobia bacterium]